MIQCLGILIGCLFFHSNMVSMILQEIILMSNFLRSFNNFWRSLEMPLINWKVELKLKWTNHCVLSAIGNENDEAKSNNNIFTIKDKKLYVHVVTLSAKNNQKLSKLFSKGFERSLYWNKYQTKSEKYNKRV